MAEPNPELSAEMSDDLIAPTETKIDTKPKFTETLLMDDDKKNLYSNFITEVRNAVKKYCRTQKGIVQPVLPPEKEKPDLWFHVKLQTKTSYITLAIRMDNLYLVGFQTPKQPQEVWWEFGKNGDTHLLDGNPRWLGFRGGYRDLIGNNGLDTVKLGREKMVGAVNELAKKMMTLEEKDEEELLLQGADQAAPDDEPPQGDPRSMLAMLVIMVCEGLRFSTVSDKVGEGFKEEVKLDTAQAKQVLKWDRISKAAFEWAEKPNAVIPEMQDLNIKNKEDLEKVVALVKDQKKKMDDEV